MEAHNSEEIGACQNMKALLRHRGYALEAEPFRPEHVKAEDLRDGQTPSEVVKSILTKLGLWEIYGRRPGAAGGPDEAIVIYLLATGGKYTRSTQDFGRLLAGAEQKAHTLLRAELREVMVIAADEVVKKKNLLSEVRARNADGKARYNIYPFKIFACVVPNNPLVPKHEIMTPAESREFLDLTCLHPSQVPVLLESDAAAVWLGARSGDYVRVWRRSETAASFVPFVRLVR